jgi:hypothetical protein
MKPYHSSHSPPRPSLSLSSLTLSSWFLLQSSPSLLNCAYATPSACPSPPSTTASPSTLTLSPDHKLRAALFWHAQATHTHTCYGVPLRPPISSYLTCSTRSGARSLTALTVLLDIIVLDDITCTVPGFCALHA